MKTACLGLAVALSATGVARAQSTTRVSVDSTGTEANDESGNRYAPCISADGRYVAFDSWASNLVSGDSNGAGDVFVHDRATGTTERASVDSSGTQGNNSSNWPSMSPDGRFIAFASFSDNLVSGDTNKTQDVFVRDRANGVTERVSVDSSGAEANGMSRISSISADGRFVAFTSSASNLVAGDTNGVGDVFVHDRATGTTERVSVDSSGAEANGDSANVYVLAISADGGVVAFESSASNLVAGDTNTDTDIFVHDRSSGITDRVSVSSSGTQANSNSATPSISGDGTSVAFWSVAQNLVAGDSFASPDVFVHDRSTGATERVSVDASGVAGNGPSSNPSISSDGRRVAFSSWATNLVPNDTNGCKDVFVYDRSSGLVERASVSSSGTEGNAVVEQSSISADGRAVAFCGHASNLVANDTNRLGDTFVRSPWLTLEAEPPSPIAGSTLTFTTWTGAVAGATLLAIVDVNGSAMFIPAVFGTFDVVGTWAFSTTVPSGLSGFTFKFETFGIVPTGKVDVSNSFDVAFP